MPTVRRHITHPPSLPWEDLTTTWCISCLFTSPLLTDNQWNPGEKSAEEDEEGEEGYGSRWDQLQAPQVLCRPAVQDCGIYIQPEPEAGKSATAVENLLRGTCTKDPSPKRL